MKPDWTKAPEWANYWAVDEDGLSYWYRLEPILFRAFGFWDNDPGDELWDLDISDGDGTDPDWRNSLQKRPE